MGMTDALSWRLDHASGAGDNNNLMLLPLELFAVRALEGLTVGCIYASYPRYKSNILQNLFKSFKLLSKHLKYSKIFFLIFLYFYSHLFKRSIIFLPYL